MPKPKTATVYVEGVTLLCAGCRDNISEPGSGSHLWTVYDLKRVAGQVIECNECGTPNRIPSNPRPRMVP
jgi:hypothetical protein